MLAIVREALQKTASCTSPNQLEVRADQGAWDGNSMLELEMEALLILAIPKKS